MEKDWVETLLLSSGFDLNRFAMRFHTVQVEIPLFYLF